MILRRLDICIGGSKIKKPQIKQIKQIINHENHERTRK